MKQVVDSSGWLEFFADGPNAAAFAAPLAKPADLIVPVITIYEVFKAVFRQRGEHEALQAIALMRQGTVIDLNEQIALLAAKLSLTYKTPMADSIILATAQQYQAQLWTQDDDFQNIPGVRYFSKTTPP
ncbi:MAG: type II toxin-antitoxin system VapC family toxin [Geobacter sp.]|jgi:predicted nucleic acid-binding protein|nr:type II toxin-antitoxin system VapC family toxin [Geobacter sp.]